MLKYRIPPIASLAAILENATGFFGKTPAVRETTERTWYNLPGPAFFCNALLLFYVASTFPCQCLLLWAQFNVVRGDRVLWRIYGQVFSQQRDAIHKAMPRLYKFALVLTANEELARGLLRGTVKSMHIRNEWQDEDASRLTAGFRRMYALWSAKLDEDPAIQKKCPPDARLFVAAFAEGTLANNAHFARFIANLAPAQRGVLYLVYGEGASYDEAAEVTALDPAGTHEAAGARARGAHAMARSARAC